MTSGRLSVTNWPLVIVDASERSSCCLRSRYQPSKTVSWGDCEDSGRRQSKARRHANAEASRKPEAIPCPPTKLSQHVQLDAEVMVPNYRTGWENVGRVTTESNSPVRPSVATAGGKSKWSTSQHLDAIFWEYNTLR